MYVAVMAMPMRKIIYYNFFPTKSEEEAAAFSGIPHQVNRCVVEAWDPSYHLPRLDPTNPWQIRRLLSQTEVTGGKFVISHNEMFRYVFDFWSLDMTNYVVQGNNMFPVTIIDYTDENLIKRHQGENVYVKNGPSETYHLGFNEVIRCRVLAPGDEIGLFWDPKSNTFGFKLLRRGNTIINSSVV